MLGFLINVGYGTSHINRDSANCITQIGVVVATVQNHSEDQFRSFRATGKVVATAQNYTNRDIHYSLHWRRDVVATAQNHTKRDLSGGDFSSPLVVATVQNHTKRD
ncbi:hypothetical protein, partial [Thalassospira xiamenensis]|uniref:hypothetical protein n=1 Tax=Thalassospira xiamenensis TaxID=220697 RepID=UPI001BAF61EF